MKDVLLNEWKGLFRNRLFMILSCVFAISLFLTTYLGIIQNNKQLEAQKEAQEHVREQWDSMDHKNPHASAHYGSYAFKPNTVLNSIDEGINSITGNVLRLEGHVQNDVMFSESSQSLIVSKFGKIKPSLIFQFIIPLFLIFLSFNTYTKERESGRLKLLLIQGATLKKIVFSKITSIWVIGLTLLLFTIFVQLIFNISHFDFDTFLRLLLLFFSYSIYYLVLINLTFFFSVCFKDSTSALSLTVVIWVVWTVFLPKIIGNTVEKMEPLPTRVVFQDEMKKDRSEGIDGHNPSDERRQEVIKETLEDFKVQNLQELADLGVNYRGVLMQADEEYGNKVWDKHFGNLYSQLQLQKNIYQLSGLVNPFASLQGLSMGLSGTDMFHHLDFLEQAEYYRRFFIKKLNDKWRDGGWENTDFFQSIEDFKYNIPPFFSFLTKYILDILILLLWLLVSFFSVKYLTERTSIL